MTTVSTVIRTFQPYNTKNKIISKISLCSEFDCECMCLNYCQIQLSSGRKPKKTTTSSTTRRSYFHIHTKKRGRRKIAVQDSVIHSFMNYTFDLRVKFLFFFTLLRLMFSSSSLNCVCDYIQNETNHNQEKFNINL